MCLNYTSWLNHFLLKIKEEEKDIRKAVLKFLRWVHVLYVHVVTQIYHKTVPWGYCEWKPSLHTTLTRVPTRHSPKAFLWMGQIAIWMKTLNKLYNSWQHVPGGLSHITTTWAVAIVLSMCRGTEEPIRMLFLSAHKKGKLQLREFSG